MSTFSVSSGIQSANTSGAGRHVSYRVVMIVVILSVVFTLSGFLHVLARCLGRYRRQLNTAGPRPHSPELVSALHGQLQELFHLHDAGLEQAFLNTLPTFAYGAIRWLKDSADCAVCLNEFADDDRLRLLPKCNHAFHLDCIDTWLLSHSTCPLCRRSLLPDLPASLCRHGDPPAMATETAIPPSARRIQVIEELLEGQMTPSPVASTICVVDERGEERMLKVELGRVAVMAQSDSRKLTTKGARSYSVGSSYEYVVELAIAGRRPLETNIPPKRSLGQRPRARERRAFLGQPRAEGAALPLPRAGASHPDRELRSLAAVSRAFLVFFRASRRPVDRHRHRTRRGRRHWSAISFDDLARNRTRYRRFNRYDPRDGVE